MSVTVVAKNTCRGLGEGPSWDARNQTLVYVDILMGEVHTHNPSTGGNSVLKAGDYVSYVIPRDSGDYIIGERTHVKSLNMGTGNTQTLAVVTSGDKPVQNDAKCDSRGRLWTGTLGAQIPDAIFEEVYGSLYCVGSDLQVTQHYNPLRYSNGLAWSPDYRVFYLIDSLQSSVLAFNFDLNAGTITNQRVALRFTDEELGGKADGMCADQDGNLWIAVFGGGKVRQFDPNAGKELRSIDIPEAMQTTSCGFGGRDLEDLYVTSGRLVTGPWTAESLDLQPNAGSLFKVTGLGVKGMPVGTFAG